MAITVERITPQQAHAHMQSNAHAMLVCAYDSEEGFRQNHLQGAIDLNKFASKADALPKDQEVIFYCA
jgi:rhodanese-related sulfurtransferase